MMVISLMDKPLGAWLPPGASPAARAKFLRHHLHELVVDNDPFFDDEKQDPNFEVLINRALVHVPIGTYNVHLGEGIQVELTVTWLGIYLGGVLVLTTPDKRYLYVPPGHLIRLRNALEGSGQPVWLYQKQLLNRPPGQLRSGDVVPPHLLDYSIGERPKAHDDLKLRLLGKLDFNTGAIVPEDMAPPDTSVLRG